MTISSCNHQRFISIPRGLPARRHALLQSGLSMLPFCTNKVMLLEPVLCHCRVGNSATLFNIQAITTYTVQNSVSVVELFAVAERIQPKA